MVSVIYISEGSENNCQSEQNMATIIKNISHGIMSNSAICGPASMGNSLSIYIESRICANKTGLHLNSQTRIPDQDGILALPDFFPKYIENHAAASYKPDKSDSKCLCSSNICHEMPRAFIHSHPTMVRDILRPAILQHYDNWLGENAKHPRDIDPWLALLRPPYNQSNTKLPTVPEAAIHYRCGDNIIGHYGFLSFPAFTNRIPPNVSTIYVLAEAAGRNSSPSRL